MNDNEIDKEDSVDLYNKISSSNFPSTAESSIADYPYPEVSINKKNRY